VYVTDASVHLFSVKEVAQNGYCTNLNEKVIVIRRVDRIITALGKLIIDLYLLAIRVCMPGYTAEVLLAKQAQTLQVWLERLSQQNKHTIMQLLKQHDISL
jgi:hypothetical protein